MKYFALFLLSLPLIAASPQTGSNTAQKTYSKSAFLQTSGSIFRCDGFYNGIASEWVQVAFSEEGNDIDGIWYWNSEDESPVKLEILDITFSEGEISGFSGELAFPSGDKYEFGQVEDRFTLTHPGGRFQEFDYESSKP